MPRKSTRKSATTTAVDVKNEEVAPRRSGRASTKQDVSSEKDISRSRRSSTAAQTAACAADSKPGKTRGETSSATDSRTRGGKESADTSATRATRRSTGRINYKESDGEEETPTPKYDKNFESGEEYDDSESDEKSKQQGKNKPARTTKGRAVKEQVERVTRVRRGRPSKRKTDDAKTVDISDDSMEPEIIETKSGNKVTSENKSKTQSKRTRGSKSKSEVVDVELENDAKPSRRSARAVSSKEESPKKRPSRGVRAKRYAEEDEVEEILDSENVEDTKSNSESNRKRKRNSSTQESNKRTKRNERKYKDSEEDSTKDKEIVDIDMLEKDEKPEVLEKTSEDKEDHPKDEMEDLEDKIESVENKIKSSENKMKCLEDQIECAEDKIESSEDKMKSTQDKMESTQEKNESTQENTESIKEKLENTQEKTENTQEKFEHTKNTQEKTEYTQEKLECSEEKMESDEEIMEVSNEKIETTQDKIVSNEDKTESSKDETEGSKDKSKSCEDNVDGREEKGVKDGEIEDKMDVEQKVIENKERKEIIKEDSEEDEPMEVEETCSHISSEENSRITGRKESDVSEDKENIIENPQENIPPSDEIEEILCDSNESTRREQYSKSETSDQTFNQDSSDYLEASEPVTDSSGTLSNSELDSQKTKEISVTRESSQNEKVIDGQVYQPIETVRTAEETLPSAVISEINLQNEKGKFKTDESDILNKSEKSVKESNIERNEQVFLPSVQNIQTEGALNFATNVHSSDTASGLPFNGTEKLGNSVDSAAISRVSSCDDKMETSVPTTNGAHEDVLTNEKQLNHTCYSLPDRKYICNPKINDNVLQSVKNKTFGFLSYNLGLESGVQKDKLLKEIHDLNSHIVCFQQVPKPFYSSVLEPSLDALGYRSIYSQPADSLKGMATFFKNSYFSLNGHSDISLRQVVEKELEASSLESTSKAAVKSYIKRCGNALLTQFVPLNGTQSVAVVNVQIPPSDIGMHALQVSCLVREIIKLNGNANKPLLVGGEFNISQNEASYQLLRDGYLANDMIDELQKRKDIAVPEKENSSLVDLLWKSFQHPSSNLCSCYSSVLGHEVFIPNSKSASPDLLWYSSDSLLTVGIVDVNSEKVNDCHVFLKADIAFSN